MAANSRLQDDESAFRFYQGINRPAYRFPDSAAGRREFVRIRRKLQRRKAIYRQGCR